MVFGRDFPSENETLWEVNIPELPLPNNSIIFLRVIIDNDFVNTKRFFSYVLL